MKRIKTPFDQLKAVMEKHWSEPLGGKSAFDAEQLESIKAMAAELPLKDIEEDVPLTDGELLSACLGSYSTSVSYEKAAAEFLRLRAERDGVPLEVTAEDIDGWYKEFCEKNLSGRHEYNKFEAAKINAHRGVRPVKLPKVTAELCRNANRCGTFAEMADYINSALAKAKDGAE